jgi:hypothetical protein
MSYHLGMTDRALTYASYLKLQELLSLPQPLSQGSISIGILNALFC